MEENIEKKMQTILSSQSISVAEMKTLIKKAQKYKIERQKAQNEKNIGDVIASLCQNPEDLIKLLAIFKELYPDDIEGANDIKAQLEKAYKKKAQFMGVYLFMIAQSLESLYKKAFKNYVRVMQRDEKTKEKLLSKQKSKDKAIQQENINAFIQSGRKWFEDKKTDKHFLDKEFEYEQRLGNLERAFEKENNEKILKKNTKKHENTDQFYEQNSLNEPLSQTNGKSQTDVAQRELPSKKNKLLSDGGQTPVVGQSIILNEKNQEKEISMEIDHLTMKSPSIVAGVPHKNSHEQTDEQLNTPIKQIDSETSSVLNPQQQVDTVFEETQDRSLDIKTQIIETLTVGKSESESEYYMDLLDELTRPAEIRVGDYKADDFLDEFEANVQFNKAEESLRTATPQSESREIIPDTDISDFDEMFKKKALDEEICLEESIIKTDDMNLNQFNFETS